MKQLILIFSLLSVMPSVFGQGYAISGEVNGADGKTVLLRQYRDMNLVDVSSTTVNGGKFTFNGSTPYPELFLLFVGDKTEPLLFFAENSDIRIVVDLADIGKSKVTGSKENELYMELMSNLEKFTQRQQQLNDSYAALASSNNVSENAVMKLRADYEQVQRDNKLYLANFAAAHQGKVISAFVVSNALLADMDISQVESFVNTFDAKTSGSQWVKALNEHVLKHKRTGIGQPFIDITLKTPDDKPVSISDYAGKGKYVLLDFWAAWCGPCRNANPHVVELYKKYKDKGFEIVGISLDKDRDAWIKAIKDDNLPWPQMSDLGYWQSAAAKLYSVSSIPFTVLLDKDGKIIAKGLYVNELTAKLAEIFER